MSTSHLLLGLLSRGPRHGYELKREHDDRFPQAKPLPYGQVYATLGRLLRDELVAEGEPAPGDGPDRRVYDLTDAGRAALDAWLADVEPPAPYVANPLLARVVVALLADGRAGDYLGAQRRAHLARMRELTAVKAAPGARLSDVLTADWALSHLDADLRWVESTAQRLDALTTEVRSR
jgi:DNA-binding PadR family transcriptional regulator